ncbi:MAG: hypothetical protein ACREJB_17015, partial [Planctomycetaceae bacterium]
SRLTQRRRADPVFVTPMSYLLCHECYSWVEPHSDRCPDCLIVLDASSPDPSPDVLETVMGEVICRLGEVRFRRRILPDTGTLYATTRGLCFVPHEMAYETCEVAAEPAGSSLFWLLVGMTWSPLSIIRPLVQPKRRELQCVPVFHPTELAVGESRRLPELLMANPGVFFVPRRSIRAIAGGRFGWRIERIGGATFRFKPQETRRQFHARLSHLAEFPMWRNVLPG